MLFRSKAEIIIGKHRNGPTGSIELLFIPQYTAFGDLEYRSYNIEEAEGRGTETTAK